MVKIFNLEILEPGTFISDLIMGLACFLFFIGLKKVSLNRFHKHLSHYFLFMALSALTSAFAHTFFLYTGKFLHLISWLATGIAIYFIEYGLSPLMKNQDRFINIIRIQLVLYVVLVISFMDFSINKVNTALGLLCVVSPILLFRAIKFDEKYYIYSIAGIVLAIIPALFHQIKFTFAIIFNMNDLSHFFLILCQFLLFLGLKQGISNNQMQYSEANA